jgi:hypothetical protein
VQRIRPWLYVGSYRDTLDEPLLTSRGIGAMLQLAEHVPQPGITTLYVACEDGVPLPPYVLKRGIGFIRITQEQSLALLIACGAGISRSVTFAIAALREVEGLGLADAFAVVKKNHPEAMPHYELWDSLCAYYGEDIPYVSIWK